MAAKLPEFRKPPVIAPLSASQEDQRKQRWRCLIDHRLIEWGAHPERCEDDDVTAPTREAIQSAIRLAETLHDDDERPVREPNWLVATGDGGIALRWGHQGQLLFSYECWPSGRVEFVVSENARVISRDDII